MEGNLQLAPQPLLQALGPRNTCWLCALSPVSLWSRLAIQMEENGILRDALGSALRGKEEDFRMYHQTLGQVKGVFLQALRKQKANKQ